ncbi:MAG: hypothetical protein GX458_05875 [Phyllobacteriaceae bacterium]|nr:hypothetical protein [Phyllobacteriaceae bacterium]
MLSRFIRALRAGDLAARWRAGGILVLVAGASAAAVAWARAVAPAAVEIPMSRLKAQEVALERLGGRFAVEAAKFDDWLAGLWSGEALPRTLLVLTLAAVVLCFWIAHLAEDGDAGSDDRRR